MGRALTGNMPEDPNEEDFNVFTTGLSTFVRRSVPSPETTMTTTTTTTIRRTVPEGDSNDEDLLAPGTKISDSSHIRSVPDWMNGKGVGGGWDCVSNGDCSFLSGGEERGWYVIVFSPFLFSFFSFSRIVEMFESFE
jgi:transcription factor C subunit 7